MPDDITAHDARRRRCPMLGHDVPFAYCRAPACDLPCRKVADCWWEMFDVEAYLRAHFTGEQIARFLAPPAPKIASLVELIEKARNTTGEKP